MDKKLKILNAFHGMDEIRLDALHQACGIQNIDEFQILLDELALSHFITSGHDDMHVRLYSCSAIGRYKKGRAQKRVSNSITALGLIASIIAAVFGGIQLLGPGIFHR